MSMSGTGGPVELHAGKARSPIPDDVEALGLDPVGKTEHTRALDVVGKADQIADRHVGRREAINSGRFDLRVGAAG